LAVSGADAAARQGDLPGGDQRDHGQAAKAVAPAFEGAARFAGAITPATLQFMWKQAPDRMSKSVEYLYDQATNAYQHPDVRAEDQDACGSIGSDEDRASSLRRWFS